MESSGEHPARDHKDVQAASKVAAESAGDEQALARTACDEEIDERLESLDLATKRRATGLPTVVLDDQDRVVLHHLDDRIELRRR